MARGDTLTYSAQLVTEECCNCGITFAMPEDYKDRLRRETTKATFYCPTGHPQHYVGESDAQKLREAADEAAKLRAENGQLAAANRTLTKGVLDRAKKLNSARQRAKAGMCLHCRRHFANVKAHVSKQHPNK